MVQIVFEFKISIIFECIHQERNTDMWGDEHVSKVQT